MYDFYFVKNMHVEDEGNMRTQGENKVVRQYIPKQNVNSKKGCFDLKRMQDGFILEQSCRGNSAETVKYYEGNIRRFIEYLDKNSRLIILQ
jgi:hypothetical protein